MILYKGYKVILRAIKIPGVISTCGVETYFVEEDGIYYIVSLDSNYIKKFRIEKHNIYKVYDLDNNLIYEHDRSDNL